MKILIAIVLFAIMVVAGVTSLALFKDYNYDLSHVLVLATFLCSVGGIYELTARGRKTIRSSF